MSSIFKKFQTEQTLQLCDKLVQTYPDTKGQAVLIKAVLFARDGKPQEASKLLTDYANKSPSNQLEMRLSAVQLLLSEVINKVD